MSIIDYLRMKKNQLLNADKRVQDVRESTLPNIDIVIENPSGLFENEPELIMSGANIFLENKNVESLEEGIIAFATMIRGLKYLRSETEDDGTIKVYFRDNTLENTHHKSL